MVDQAVVGGAMFDFISFPAFVIAFVLHMMMGMVWYHPKIFGHAFMKLAHGGRSPDPAPTAIKAAILGTLIAMPFFSFMLSVVGCRTPGEGSLWGFAFGLFFDGGLNASHSFFEEKPFALFALHRGYHVTSLSLIGAVLGALCGPSAWYSKFLFGPQMQMLANVNRTMRQSNTDGFTALAIGGAMSLPLFIIVISAAGCQSWYEGALWGLGFGFFDLGLNASHTFFEKRPFELFVVHRGYHIMSLTTIGALLGFLCGEHIH